MAGSFLKKLFGDSNSAEIKRLEKIAAKIDSYEDAHRRLSEEELRGMTEKFRARLAAGETLDDLLPEAFSVMREAMGRVLGKRHFHVQMLGGIVLHQGRIAEMKTGEGKTLVATLAQLFERAGRQGRACRYRQRLSRHAFRANGWARCIRYLGMTRRRDRRTIWTTRRASAAYAADVTYGTNNEFGFDYLRDNMVIYKKDMVQRGHNFAIIDEADSILIDEARTPLIISGQGDKANDMYARADQFVSRLREGEDADYTKDEKEKGVSLTEKGIARAESFFGVENLADVENSDLNHYINAALRANALMKRDVDYVVKDGQVDHRRRVYRPSDDRPPLLRRSASGDRSEGTRYRRARKQDACNDHVPELFPYVQKTLRHDRYGKNGRGRIQRHLQPRRRAAFPPTAR